MGGYKLCSGVLGTSSGISSSSVSGLVGIEDAEQHGISGVNAGHWHFSLLQSWHKTGFISFDNFILLKAVSKSKLALICLGFYDMSWQHCHLR